MLIKNALIVSPANGIHHKSDLRIENGRIREIGSIAPYTGEDTIDAGGLILSPGLIDTHVHFRDPGQTWKEDLHTGALAAAAGGFTTVICMANTVPKVDSVETLQDIRKRAANEPVTILQSAAVTVNFDGKTLTPMEDLSEAGAAGFTDDGIPILDDAVLTEALKRAKALSLPVSLHEEDPAYIKESGVNAGPAANALGLSGADRNAEITMVERDCALALSTGACMVIQHVSCGESVEIIRKYKALGVDLHAEATPHHFSLTEEAVGLYGTCAKMNPPLRTEKDRQAILSGLKDGTLDLIATDHAPHSASEKAREFTKAPSGIIGLETSLALGITNLVKTGVLSIDELIEKMSVDPAKLYSPEAGRIAEGAPADLTLIDTEKEWTPGNYRSKAVNSPFTGMRLTGKVVLTIHRGRISYSCF